MKLDKPFIKLPLIFDTERLAHEAGQFTEQDWRPHPSGYAGNTSLILISHKGEMNDDAAGRMESTVHLERCPYIRQILNTFQSVFGRSRLMRLAPGSQVKEHSDINYHWYSRVRIHMPIVTYPEVQFFCGDDQVNMVAGEAWIFDAWRKHRVENTTDQSRIHLVADTTGSPAFWNMVSDSVKMSNDSVQPEFVPFDPASNPAVRTERYNSPVVMSPGEIDALLLDILADIDPVKNPDTANVEAFTEIVNEFRWGWRTAWGEFGPDREGWPGYRKLLHRVATRIKAVHSPLLLKSNGTDAIKVLYARVISHAHNPDALEDSSQTPGKPAALTVSTGGKGTAAGKHIIDAMVSRLTEHIGVFDRPVFIVSAPRSGSTLLFETLSKCDDFWTVGDESHAIIESIPALRPGAPGVNSNRLSKEQSDPTTAYLLRLNFFQNLRDRDGTPATVSGLPHMRMLEKTPKNALRIPFLKAVFPDALFIYLYRDTRDNVSSMIDAWKSGRWVTYRKLRGWNGNWSLLLPPGWQDMQGKSVEEVAAFQWKAANETILDDLGALDDDCWTIASYRELTEDPQALVRRLCAFAGVSVDAALVQHLGGELPLSKYTLDPPSADKWKKNEQALTRILPALEGLAERIDSTCAGKRPLVE